MTEKTPLKTKTKAKKPWQLIAILVVSALPIIGAYIAYFTGVGIPKETVNQGDLISPVIDLRPVVDDASTLFGQDYKWRIFIPFRGQCGDDCQTNLYVSRQVHIRLGEKAARIERYFVDLTGNESGKAFYTNLKKEHPRLQLVTAQSKLWQESFKSYDDKHRYYIADSTGFAVLAFNAQHSGNELLKDIKRILKHAPED